MRIRILFGMLSGALIAFGLSLILFLLSMHHMFIIAISSPIAIIFHATPAVLVLAGIVIGIRALKH